MITFQIIVGLCLLLMALVCVILTYMALTVRREYSAKMREYDQMCDALRQHKRHIETRIKELDTVSMPLAQQLRIAKALVENNDPDRANADKDQ